jgi:hypothetical protein
MANPERIDPFVSTEEEVEVDEERQRILKERMKSADEGHVISAEEARKQFRQWLSNSATTKKP